MKLSIYSIETAKGGLTMELIDKEACYGQSAKDCQACMSGAPYDFCCKHECGEHEFCRGCSYGRKS